MRHGAPPPKLRQDFGFKVKEMQKWVQEQKQDAMVKPLVVIIVQVLSVLLTFSSCQGESPLNEKTNLASVARLFIADCSPHTVFSYNRSFFSQNGSGS